MKGSALIRSLVAAAIAGIAFAASAQQAADHTQHQMSTMQALHAKMAAANTPTERQELMADHRKAMQEGMVMTMQRNATCICG